MNRQGKILRRLSYVLLYQNCIFNLVNTLKIQNLSKNLALGTLSNEPLAGKKIKMAIIRTSSSEFHFEFNELTR